ncbi:hypothetical protein UO65_3204 [Actinokineospora spheciospongiae]|uniref:Uncharacterized protein n=1 Tax=Actinokineospora spheciospongiae TaxID=909613 RepID=W7IY98_9PSEU|nr:hypothetical protein UO65_3204 [Actinokineospora spheciospongiae]
MDNPAPGTADPTTVLGMAVLTVRLHVDLLRVTSAACR